MVDMRPQVGKDRYIWGQKLLDWIETVIAPEGGINTGFLSGYINDTLNAGTNISLSYDDLAGQITITNLITTEVIRDTVNGLVAAGDGITVVYDDMGDTLTISGDFTAIETEIQAVIDSVDASALDITALQTRTGTVLNTDGSFVDAEVMASVVAEGGPTAVEWSDIESAVAPLVTPGTEGQVMTVVGGNADWADAPAVSQTYDVTNTEFGAVADGDLVAGTGSNNRAAYIAAMTAVEVAMDAGEISAATILFPDGVFRIEHTGASVGPQSMYIACPITRDNVTIQLSPGTVIMLRTGHANNVQVFGPHGWSKPNGPADWIDHWVAYPGSVADHPCYTMTGPVAKGASTITLATAGDAVNFAEGDAVHIRSGQTLAIQGTTANEPSAELNEIVSADAGTGVLTLKYPVGKAYVQEYLPSAPANGVGPSTTSVTAFPTLFGVQNIQNAVLRNVRVLGGTFDLRPAAGRVFAFYPVQVMGWEFTSDVNAENGIPQNGGTHSDGDFHDVKADLASTLITHDAFYSANTGSSRHRLRDSTIVTREGVHILHTHEDTTDFEMDNVAIINPVSTSNVHAWQVIARGHNLRGTNLHIEHNTPNGNCIYTTSETDGLVLDNIRGTGRASIEGTNVSLGLFEGIIPRLAGSGAKIALQERIYHVDIYHDSPASIDVVSFFANTKVTRVELEVFTPFTGGTGATIKAAKKGGYDQWFMNLFALAGKTQGPQDIVREPTTCYYQQGSDPTVELQYTANGATAGRAVFTFAWTPCEQLSGV